MKLWTYDLKDSLRFGSMLPFRWALAMASLCYAGLTAFGPEVRALPNATTIGSLVLTSDWKWAWALAFLLDSALLWWRIFEDKSRPNWAAFTNILSLALWAGVLLGTVISSDILSPGLTGYVIFVMMSLQVLWRTEYTLRDRNTA